MTPDHRTSQKNGGLSVGGCGLTYMEGSVDKPHICLDGNGTDGEGGIEWDRPPVVIVGVKGLGDDLSSQLSGIGCQVSRIVGE